MKVGTDGVLLGAWCTVGDAKRILDIGTGTGLIAIMLAQRSGDESLIDAIEIDHETYLQAVDNISNCPWQSKINPINTSLQLYSPDLKYDLIVCNPPFFTDSLKPPNQKRTQSRHTDSLPFTVIIEKIKKYLSDGGLFCLVLPYKEGKDFIYHAGKSGLYCTKMTEVISKPSKPIERLLLEFSLTGKNFTKDELLLNNDIGKWTNQYQKLVFPFYLNA